MTVTENEINERLCGKSRRKKKSSLPALFDTIFKKKPKKNQIRSFPLDESVGKKNSRNGDRGDATAHNTTAPFSVRNDLVRSESARHAELLLGQRDK